MKGMRFETSLCTSEIMGAFAAHPLRRHAFRGAAKRYFAGDSRDALGTVRRYANRCRSNADRRGILLLSAMCLVDMSEDRAATAMLAQYLELDPAPKHRAEACRMLGHLYEKQGDLAEAKRCFTDVTRFEHKCAESYLDLARVCIKRGESADARACAEKARRLDPDGAANYAIDALFSEGA